MLILVLKPIRDLTLYELKLANYLIENEEIKFIGKNF